jgi:hypothetical protein
MDAGGVARRIVGRPWAEPYANAQGRAKAFIFQRASGKSARRKMAA